MIADLLLLVGSALILIAGIGIVRFGDIFVRMHAVTKANVAGVVLALVGASFGVTDPNDITSLVLAAVLQVLTAPIAANLLSRSTYFSSEIDKDIDTVDELAEAAADASRGRPQGSRGLDTLGP